MWVVVLALPLLVPMILAEELLEQQTPSNVLTFDSERYTLYL